MSTEQLPDGLQLAVNLLEGDRDAFVVCHRHPIHGLEQEDAEIAGEYLGAINAIRDEHAKRLTLQHHAADMAQQIEDLRFAAEAGGRRIAELEAGRDALRARLAEIEAQEPAAVISSSYDIHYAGSEPISVVVERHGLKVGSPLYARPVTAQALTSVYLVAAGVTQYGQELYTRHDAPVPMAENEKLYAAAPEHKA